MIKEKEKTINLELFKKYFIYQSPSKMYNVLSDTKNIEKRNTQVNLIKSGLIDLKKDIEDESKDDVNKIGEMYKIADIAELILKFNDDDDDEKQFHFTDMLELESEEFAAQRINT